MRTLNLRTLSITLACWLGLALGALPGSTANWNLWESPNGNTEVLDQSQTIYTTQAFSMNPIGQTFTPQATPLTRMDFRISSNWDYINQPFSVKLWQWNTDYATTVAQAPVFQDMVSVPGMAGIDLYSVFPNNVAVTPGALYFIEFKAISAGGEWFIYGANTNAYANGQARTNGVFRDDLDIFFKTYTTPQGTPTLPTFASSTTGAWTAPTSPGTVPTATDYLNTITSYEATYCGSYKTTPGVWCAYMSIYDSFLWKATGNTARAADAITMFENTYAYVQANPGTHMAGQIECPGWSWLWLKDYPGLTQTNRDHIGWLFVDAARSSWWPVRSSGIQNQTFGCMLFVKMCLNEFPSLLTSQEITDWTAYCDSHWNEWKQYWDVDEDSQVYSQFSLRLLMQLAELYGEDTTLWQQAGFKGWIDNFFEQCTPLGPMPAYGSTNGWAQRWATPVWIFEKAAAKFNDAKYRWAAYRCYDYHKQHYKNNPSLWYGAEYNDIFGLCHAYFDMNGSLTPTERVQGEVLAEKQDGYQNYAIWPNATTKVCGYKLKLTASPLVRLDLLITRDGGDTTTTPGQITLWKWNTDRATTIAQTPLYQDDIDLTMPVNVYTLRTFYPFLDVVVGDYYYVEFTRPLSDPYKQYYIRTFHDGATDVYPDGTAYQNGGWQPLNDLWFKTYTLSKVGSTYTTHQGVEARLPSQRGSPKRWFDWRDEVVPDKLTLKSSNNLDAFTMSVNLCVAPYGHGHQEAGAILAVTHKGSVIYSDGTYSDDDDIDHNSPILKRYTGGACSSLEYRTFMSHFTDYRKATVAWITHNDLAGWDVSRERRFLFVKDRFALVRDRATAASATKAALGSVWHGHDVDATHGANWYETYNRVPWGINGWQWKNPQQSMVLYFVPRTGQEVAEWLEPTYPQTYPAANPPNAGYVMYAKRQLDFTAGQSVWVDTVLLPHGTELTPSQAAGNIAVLYDDGQAVAIQVIVGNETWTVVDNPYRTSINQTGLVTDARYLITRTQTGVADYILAQEATTVQVGSINKSWAVATNVEIGGY
ncbi:MAG: hypothetical protein ACYC7E_08475 [Armatimonadota bacterium]